MQVAFAINQRNSAGPASNILMVSGFFLIPYARLQMQYTGIFFSFPTLTAISNKT